MLRLSTISILKFSAFLLLLSMPHLFFAQGTIWKNVENEPNVAGKRYFIPSKYRVIQLDIEQLKGTMRRAPMEFTSAARNSDVILELPMPNNQIQKFRVVESPIMEDGLAKQYPDIKTYSGISLDNARTTVRFDITPKGFHAMVLSPEGTFFVDPYSSGTTEYYISYDKKDHVSDKSFVCEVADNGLPTIEVPNKNKLNNQNLPNPLDYSSSDIGNRFGDCALRTYRLALAATGEYTTFHGGTIAGALAAQVTSMNRVNGVYIQDLSVKMIIVANNNLIIYTNAATDPYSNNSGSAMLSQNQTNLDAVIGSANYDIGHVFSTGGGGVAYLNSPCDNTLKAGGVTGSSSPVGDNFDIDYVAHEMGHQFGGNHSYNNSCGGNRNATTAFEPGSGTTIMGYAGICSPDIQAHSDAYFHGGNLAEMHTFIIGAGNTCAAKPTYTNAFPSITSATTSQTIPKGTPIVLTGAATDADGNASISYCWEQMDVQISTQAPLSTATGGPNFRSYYPSSNNSRYLPRLSDLAANATTTWEVLPTVARVLKFRLVARDNALGGGCTDNTDITLTVDAASGPLVVNIPSATGITWAGSSSQTVTWAVANTNVAPVSCATVDILLSTDGGLTYPTTLATNVTNNGSATITVPNIATTTARIMVRGSGKAFFDISNNNFTITAGSCTAPVATAPTVTQPTCSVPTGTIVVNATGTGTLEYSVNNGSTWQVSSTFSGLSVGTYTVIVRLQATPTCVSTSTSVVINAVSGAPTAPVVGAITQPTCSVATGSVVLSGLPSGSWTINPGGITGTTTSTTITGLVAGTYSYTVTNSLGCISSASGNVVINPQPTTPTVPTVGAITQPTCSVSTGSVVLSGLPSTGTWTLTRTPGSVQTTGTGTSTTVTSLPAGTFTYTVTNASGCSSTATSNVVINPAPGAPTAPSVGAITQPTCSVATGSVVLSGLPSGSWTINPGGITGTTTSTTISGLAAGTYTFTVTNSVGCASPATSSVVINVQPLATAPSVGTITQPTCSVATGSVVLSGLPTGNWTINPGGITGSTTSTTISGLVAGTYSYTVTNGAGCTSPSSTNIVINAQPSTPTAPVVGAITQPTCLAPTGSVALSGLPSSGTWTIMPGNVTGSGTSTTVSGLVAGTYTFTVMNSGGCTSVSSTSVVITAATGCCTTSTPPTVTLTSPANGGVAATNVVLSATAADADGTISQVNFYWVTGITKTGVISRVLLNSDNTAPYSYTWANVAGGNYNVQAEAVDNCGKSTFSAMSNVNVLETFTVIITSPTNGQSIIAGSNVTVSASVIAYASRIVTKVEFYRGNTKIGEDLTAPYTYLMTNVPSGNFTLTAKAIDNTGAVWSSPLYFLTGTAARNIVERNDFNNVSSELTMNTSPNPARNQVVLNANVSQDGDYGLTISDFIGRVVVSKNMTYVKGANIETLNVSALTKGIYIIRLANKEGGESAVQKLIID